LNRDKPLYSSNKCKRKRSKKVAIKLYKANKFENQPYLKTKRKIDFAAKDMCRQIMKIMQYDFIDFEKEDPDDHSGPNYREELEPRLLAYVR
jgi:hypothetical protein